MATSFWESVAPGAAQAGAGMLSSYFTGKDDENRLKRAQDPMYNQAMGQAQQSLSLAGNMDPAAAAKKRFDQQQGLLAPGYDKQMQDLQRMATLRGQSGISSYSPVPGTVQTPGQPINPQMAALLAAQSGEKAQSAYDSLNQGEQQLDRLISRSGMLAGQARGQRAGNLAVQPKKPSLGSQITGALPGLFGNKDVMSGMLGGIGKGFDWLKGLGGGGGQFGSFSGGSEWAPFQRVEEYND